jgi:hypothetical protein
MYFSATSLLVILCSGFIFLGIGSSTSQHQLLVLGQNGTGNASTSSGGNNTQTAINTFDAGGTISSLAVDTLTGSNTSLGTHTGDLWLLGGNWSFSINNGNLSDFNADIVMTKHDGTGRHMHLIDMLTNTSGAIPPLTESTIALTNQNYTSFMGNANITAGEQIKYQGVPLVVYLNNGNALNINVDPIKTEHHFKGLPIFGTVTSITDGSGKQLRAEG